MFSAASVISFLWTIKSIKGKTLSTSLRSLPTWKPWKDALVTTQKWDDYKLIWGEGVGEEGLLWLITMFFSYSSLSLICYNKKKLGFLETITAVSQAIGLKSPNSSRNWRFCVHFEAMKNRFEAMKNREVAWGLGQNLSVTKNRFVFECNL